MGTTNGGYADGVDMHALAYIAKKLELSGRPTLTVSY